MKKLTFVYTIMFFLSLVAILLFWGLSINYIGENKLGENSWQGMGETSSLASKIVDPALAADFDTPGFNPNQGIELTPVFIQGAEYPLNKIDPVYYFPKYQMTVMNISNKDLDYFYFTQNPPTLSSIAQERNCEIAFNASYFAGEKENASHVGLLSIWGHQYVPLGVDNQLTHVAVFNKLSQSVQFFDANSYQSAPSVEKLEFQTGPLVLEDGIVQDGFIMNSKHGKFRHKRLLLARNNSNQTFVIIVRSQVDLIELGNFLKGLSILGEGVDVLNLDGGKSVALWSRNYSNENYNENDTLPLVICVR